MPRDGTGVPALQPLSHVLRKHRLKLLSRAARRAAASRRRATKARLAEAERLLRAIVDGGDFLGEVPLEQIYGLRAGAGVALFVTMSVYEFRRLCELGAEIEDDEDSHDAEPDMDAEPSLAAPELKNQDHWCVGSDGDYEEGADAEPSLGSTQMVNQARWPAGYFHGDNESERLGGHDHVDSADAEDGDHEPSLGAPEYHFGALSPENTGGDGGGFGIVTEVRDQTYWADRNTLDFEEGEEGEI